MTPTPPPMPDVATVANHLNACEFHHGAHLLRTQHERIAALEAENKRLNDALKWEQNRAERIGTHGPGCEKWGPAHYECALRAIERKDALLRKCLKHVASNISMKSDGTEAEELYDAIKEELK